MVILTSEQLQAKLQNIKEDSIPAITKAMNLAALNVEGKAKENCTPGKSPYWKAPYSDDNDPRREPPHMRDVMYSEVEVSGTRVRGIVGNPKQYALYVHEGTSKMQARPFIMDAIREKERDTLMILSDAILASIKKETI